VCGGCKWQHLPYPDQLKSKHRQVVDNLERIGKVEIDAINPILASENLTHYRNKLEFTFSHSRWLTSPEIESGVPVEERRALGFHIPGRFDKVLDIETCYLQPEPSNQIRLFVRQYAMSNNLTFFDIVQQKGLLRNMILRNNQAGEFMVVLSVFEDRLKEVENLLNALAEKFPQIISLMYAINPKANDTLNNIDTILFKGKDHLLETMEDLTFRISPKSFFQTNTRQAYRLYCIVRDFADLTGNEIVYDLYSGTGTIALFLARYSKKIIGIENVAEAIKDANMNSALNKVSNIDFFTGDIKDMLGETFFLQHGYPDVLITDPPRNGMHEDVVKAILLARPLKIVYVSCNPATQARDIYLLSESYRVKKCQPVDMFPYTHHVENVALLERRQ
jgi:23S rRNA (uracil1939-C5)-methyltransferase